MSPYLFVMVMEILNSILLSKFSNKEYSLHHKCNDPQITHLCFADDLFAFFQGDTVSARGLASALDIFRRATGLHVNVNKSNLFASGMDSNVLADISNILRFPIGSLPVKYLGLPLITTRLRYVDCLPLINRVQKRVLSWKSRFLSYAGRMVLIKAVLSSMNVYWTSCFVLPAAILDHIAFICRKFIWSGTSDETKRAMVAWEDICMPSV